MSDNDPKHRLHQEKIFPDSHPSWCLEQDTMQWLGKHGEDLDSIVRLERLRRENAAEYLYLTSSCKDETRRKVVAALHHNDGAAHYDDLMEYTNCTRRTVRNHVYDLRDEGVVHVEDGRPAVISFANEAVEILAEDILSKVHSTFDS